jgi:hypothetical protein
LGECYIAVQPQQKVSETPISTNQLGMVVYTCYPKRDIGRRIVLGGGKGQKKKKNHESLLEK